MTIEPFVPAIASGRLYGRGACDIKGGLAAMEKIANGNCHPVCRNAAIMLIGDLNESDPSGPPYKKALPVLLKAGPAANTIPHVRLAAWREILRHAAAGIDPENRPAVISAALAALKQHTVPEGRSPIDHDWTCRRAIDVLAAIGEPGNGGAVVSTLLAIINDGDTPIAIRCAAAEAEIGGGDLERGIKVGHTTPPPNRRQRGNNCRAHWIINSRPVVRPPGRTHVRAYSTSAR
jgi:hypothetical protein